MKRKTPKYCRAKFQMYNENKTPVQMFLHTSLLRLSVKKRLKFSVDLGHWRNRNFGYKFCSILLNKPMLFSIDFLC